MQKDTTLIIPSLNKWLEDISSEIALLRADQTSTAQQNCVDKQIRDLSLRCALVELGGDLLGAAQLGKGEASASEIAEFGSHMLWEIKTDHTINSEARTLHEIFFATLNQLEKAIEDAPKA